MQAQPRIILTESEPPIGSDTRQLASCVVERIGLTPRKRGSTQHIHKTLIEFYERAKQATAKKDPKLAVMTVDEMAIYAKITRQTMYEYLNRWLQLDIIQKVSYIDTAHKVVIGYKLNGSSLEDAFAKAKKKIIANVEKTSQYVLDLQKGLKNEKISQKRKAQSNPPTERE